MSVSYYWLGYLRVSCAMEIWFSGIAAAAHDHKHAGCGCEQAGGCLGNGADAAVAADQEGRLIGAATDDTGGIRSGVGGDNALQIDCRGGGSLAEILLDTTGEDVERGR